MALSASKIIAIIVALAGVSFVFTSSSIIDKEHAAEAAPNKKDIKKNIEKAIKKLQEKFRDNDDEKEEDEKEEDEKEEEDDEAVKTNYNYNFGDEGDNKLKDFNFVAAGDYGCSKNTKNTVSSMLDKKP